MRRLQLNHTALHKAKLHAMQTYPEECCGVLVGHETVETRLVCDVLELPNTNDENRSRRYLVAPESYRRVEEQATRAGLHILGLYHSHPDHPPKPSQFDLEHALPWWSYLIVSVEKGLPSTVRSWQLRDNRSTFDEEQLVVLDGEFVHICT